MGSSTGVVPQTPMYITAVDIAGNSIAADVPFATAAASQVAANTSAVTLLAANGARKGATIYYDGAAILYLLEGAGTPSATNWTYKLGAGLFTAYETPARFTGAIQGIWSAATGSANVTERSA